MENLLYLDRENSTVLWNHVLLLESVVNPISDRSSWQLNPIFPIIFVSVIVWKESLTPSCLRIVALSFSTLCLRISQFYSISRWRQGKGYNSVVECHLDVVEVISSSLIIPKPNVSFSIWMPWSNNNWEWIRGSWDCTRGGWAIFLGANSSRIWSAWIQVMPWNEREFRISFVYEQGSYK